MGSGSSVREARSQAAQSETIPLALLMEMMDVYAPWCEEKYSDIHPRSGPI